MSDGEGQRISSLEFEVRGLLSPVNGVETPQSETIGTVEMVRKRLKSDLKMPRPKWLITWHFLLLNYWRISYQTS